MAHGTKAMQTTQTLFIYTDTPLHVGTGMGLGSVDLPIQREPNTQHPMIQNSGVKGAVSSQLPSAYQGDKNIAFGFQLDDGGTVGGAISFGDARIIVFPVQSLRGIHAYITCPAVLSGFSSWLSYQNQAELPSITLIDDIAQCSSDRILIDDKAVLDNTPLPTIVSDIAQEWAQWLATYALSSQPVYDTAKAHFLDYFVIVSDEDFQNYVTQGTQEITRIKMDRNTRTTEHGALFTQELLPAESLFYTPVFANKPRAKARDYKRASALTANITTVDLLNWLADVLPHHIQIGADESIGCGFVTLQLLIPQEVN